MAFYKDKNWVVNLPLGLSVVRLFTLRTIHLIVTKCVNLSRKLTNTWVELKPRNEMPFNKILNLLPLALPIKLVHVRHNECVSFISRILWDFSFSFFLFLLNLAWNLECTRKRLRKKHKQTKSWAEKRKEKHFKRRLGLEVYQFF